MSDEKHSASFDQEINVRALAGLTVALVVVVVTASALMWPLTLGMRDRGAAQDPPPPVLEEARQPHEPPSPRLQSEPFGDLHELRATEDHILTTYGWVDEEAGLARIPIDRAIDLVVEHGIPQYAPTGEN